MVAIPALAVEFVNLRRNLQMQLHGRHARREAFSLSCSLLVLITLVGPSATVNCEIGLRPINSLVDWTLSPKIQSNEIFTFKILYNYIEI